jgi:hypothetical protein
MHHMVHPGGVSNMGTALVAFFPNLFVSFLSGLHIFVDYYLL